MTRWIRNSEDSISINDLLPLDRPKRWGNFTFYFIDGKLTFEYASIVDAMRIELSADELQLLKDFLNDHAEGWSDVFRAEDAKGEFP